MEFDYKVAAQELFVYYKGGVDVLLEVDVCLYIYMPSFKWH